jgi:PAS domain-containing protein
MIVSQVGFQVRPRGAWQRIWVTAIRRIAQVSCRFPIYYSGRSIRVGSGTEHVWGIASFGAEGAEMTGQYVDYEALYQQLPIPVLLLTPEFVIADANEAYLATTGRTREQLAGRHLFAAFPDNPADPDATGVRDIRESLGKVMATGKPDVRTLQRYDVEVPGRPGEFAARYWHPCNAPVFGPDGQIVLIAHCVEEMTSRVSHFLEGLSKDDLADWPD